jgi:hypothetical protein
MAEKIAGMLPSGTSRFKQNKVSTESKNKEIYILGYNAM